MGPWRCRSTEGGGGADRLHGNGGNDVLVGGDGGDTFVFTGTLAADGLDRSSDFEAGLDLIEIGAAAFGGGLSAGGTVQLVSGAAPSSAGFTDGVFLYNTGNGFLSFDANGQAAGGAVVFFRLQNRAALTDSDFIVVA